MKTKTIATILLSVMLLSMVSACSTGNRVGGWWQNQRWEAGAGGSEG